MAKEYLAGLFGLDGQVAVVIGGAGVLGGALCEGIGRAGARVLVADCAEDRCGERVAELARRGVAAQYALVDVTRRASIEALLARALTLKGRVEILVNAAGVNAGSTFLEASEADWDRVMAINLKAVFQTCQVFARHMVGVTSLLPLSRVFAYSASKAGLLNLTRNVAREFGREGVRCNALCPGFFPAEQNRKLLDEERVDNIMRHTPMARFGEPEELVGAALLLLSPTAGRFITGAVVSVDGGFTAAWF